MTLTDNIIIDNLKCGGCQAAIKKTLHKIKGVDAVAIDDKTSAVSITHDTEVTRNTLTQALKAMGYPETGTVQGFDKVLTEGKSYLSCAVGRLSDDKNEW